MLTSVYYGCQYIYLLPVIIMKKTQLARTLTSLCEAYLNTIYISVEDIVDVFDYEQKEEIVERFRKIMEPVRDKRFEDFIDKGEWSEDDLEDLAWKLAMKLKRLDLKLKDEERVEALGIGIGKKLIEEWKQWLKWDDLRDYVWNELFKADTHIDFCEVMEVVYRVIGNWYSMQ